MATATEKKAEKKARNIAQYEARNARLRERQKLAAELRQRGYVGNDDAVIRKYEAEQRAEADRVRNEQRVAKEAARIAAEQAKHQAEQSFISEALNGPSAKILTRWLAMRVATYERVKRFFDERPNLKRVAEKAA